MDCYGERALTPNLHRHGHRGLKYRDRPRMSCGKSNRSGCNGNTLCGTLVGSDWTFFRQFSIKAREETEDYDCGWELAKKGRRADRIPLTGLQLNF